jgi:deoxyribonuclease-4
MGNCMSVHAPYYINLASQEEEARMKKSIQYLVRSAEAAQWLGATRVVFHPGSAGKDRILALETAKKVLLQALEDCSHTLQTESNYVRKPWENETNWST